MKKPVIFLAILSLVQIAMAGGVSSTEGDVMFYLFLTLAFAVLAGGVALSSFLYRQIKTIAWIPIPFFLYMYSFWRRYC